MLKAIHKYQIVGSRRQGELVQVEGNLRQCIFRDENSEVENLLDLRIMEVQISYHNTKFKIKLKSRREGSR